MNDPSAPIFFSMLTMMVCAVAAYLWFGIEDRNFHCIPANGYDSLVTECAISAVPTLDRFYRTKGYRRTGVTKDVAHPKKVYLFYERGA
jgi:hypothetical protein